MIVIQAKFTVKPEEVDIFLKKVGPFTEATRAEPGNLWFDWFRSVDQENVFLLSEAFADDAAGSTHVNSRHFAEGTETLRQLVTTTPDIISRSVEGTGWDKMGEITVDTID